MNERVCILDTLSLVIFLSALLLVKIVQELCESGGGPPRLSVVTSLLVSVDVKLC